MTLELRLRDGDRRRIPVEAGRRLIIGRSADCDVTLADQSVSRRHCAVEAAGAGLAVTDLGSVNGTFVNGRAVATARLAPGDVLRAGAVELECRGEGGGLGRPRTAEVGGDASTIETVVSRQIVPSRVDWLGASSGGDQGVLLDRAQRHLTTLHAVAEMLSRAHDVTALSDAIVEAVLEVTGADRAALLVAGPDGAGAEPVAARGGDDAPFTVSRTIVAEVIGQGVSVFARDATADPRFEAGASVVRQQVRSVMCVPLRTADAILGALYVDSLRGAGRFSDADLELLAAVGNQAGVALHRVRLMGDLERLFLDTVKAIAATVDAKDGYTHRHSERVAAFAGRIGAALGLSADELHTAELAALLHDVGKIAVPDSILNKAGRLSPEEFEAIKQHPALGARILGNIQGPAAAAIIPGVRYHHEKWDGTGYPEGLQGEAIPVVGRLIGAADFLDALTSARAYRAGMPMEEAVRSMREGAGTHFDPRIVEVVEALQGRGLLADLAE